MAFSLHPQLEKDTSHIGDFPLCTVLLHKDAAVPWVILVPKEENLKELHHLSMDKQQQYLVESQLICQTLEKLFEPDKLNTGALGNMVPQLHLHHIARYKNDPVWPGPVWGNTSGERRSEENQQKMVGQLREALTHSPIFK
ncbi:putative Diadenosine tetraphosphate (Ap4A) hydrolase and other HIT family hydrolase [Vibrio nigripulchritudo MADA3029]|uniref:HIT domain-containing protein n=1 Tax=Vibrio nigripulchritudo TaxID=28173 RepID=UPI0003B24269|nr:HIT domain-containing protein [Vibrio nigripulchritudo]CCN48456.1 putative Diadenosine tetraphosphate (Ap4A) hydrolase and other HIT family hydrolase [Vibrio nigripulchritudo MADA3020]CCN52228.1 putative Diadenosine tetraphosphate (Ap4A) hydrolase and other HIT family hydrolase [Vibrio nigripulchritudo MADA3021]CCN58048.1 putative Diadenosine tetraphosphate (Ap4A) hydrolase and other HIT family hydrolase [Vibrio nigripulchritudo MADA3029]